MKISMSKAGSSSGSLPPGSIPQDVPVQTSDKPSSGLRSRLKRTVQRLGDAFPSSKVDPANRGPSNRGPSATQRKNFPRQTLSPIWQRLKIAAQNFKKACESNDDAGRAKLHRYVPVEVEINQGGQTCSHSVNALKLRIDRSGSGNNRATQGNDPGQTPAIDYFCGRMETGQSDAALFELEKSMLLGIQSGQGVFEFVSRKAHFRPAESVATPLITLLRTQWHHQKNRGNDLVLGGRYKIIGLDPEHAPPLLGHGVIPQAEDMCHQCTVTVQDLQNPDAGSKKIPFTQLGLEYKEKILGARQIEQAHKILLQHQSQYIGAGSSAGQDTALLPMIASTSGKGRAPTLIAYSEIVRRIDANLVRCERSLDAALFDVIERGRKARISDDLQKGRTPDLQGFVRCDRQLKELETALSSYMQAKAANATPQHATATAQPIATTPQPAATTVPRTAPAASSEQIRAWKTEAFSPLRFELRDNPGSGNCLFHALEYTQATPWLTDDMVKSIRQSVSDVKRKEAPTPEGSNGNLQQLGAAFRENGLKLLLAEDKRSTYEIYADYQATEKRFAGTDEVRQWLQLPRNSAKTVVMVDANQGEERIDTFTPLIDAATNQIKINTVSKTFPTGGSAAPSSFAQIQKTIAAAIYAKDSIDASGIGLIPDNRIVLYRTPAHFVRIVGRENVRPGT